MSTSGRIGPSAHFSAVLAEGSVRACRLLLPLEALFDLVQVFIAMYRAADVDRTAHVDDLLEQIRARGVERRVGRPRGLDRLLCGDTRRQVPTIALWRSH